MKLDLVMIVKDAASTLPRCLESFRTEVDDIIIVDTGSSDDTQTVAKRYDSKIYQIPWENNFAKARNAALQKSDADWRLVIDSDEYLTAGNNLKKAILEQQALHASFVGRLRIRSKFQTNGNIQYENSYVSRILPREAFYEGAIHEQVVHPGLPIIQFDGFVVDHDGYFGSHKSERNIPILMDLLECEPNSFYHLFQLAREHRNVKQFESAHQLLIKALQICPATSSIFPMLIVDLIYNCIELKYFEQGLYTIERYESQLAWYPDFHFACGIFYMKWILYDPSKFLYFPRIETAYLRCLSLGDENITTSVEGTGSYLAAHNLASLYEASGNLEKAKIYQHLETKWRKDHRISF